MRRRTKFLKRTTSVLIDNWMYTLIIIALAAVSIGILFFQLSTLLPGPNAAELNNLNNISEGAINPIHALIQEPIFLPFTFGMYLLQLFSLDSIGWLRSISVAFGLLSVLSVYYIISRWHTFRVSVLATLLYATSAGLLHVARLGDEQSTYLLLPLVIAIGLYGKGQKAIAPKLIALALAAILTLYLPGTIWIVLVLSALYYREIIASAKKIVLPIKSVAAAISAVFIGLLTFSFISNPDQFLLWLGLPVEDLPTLAEFAIQLALVPVTLFAWGPTDPSMWVGTAGIIDFFVGVLFILGCYSYFYQRKLDRTKFLFVTILVLTVLAGLGGPVNAFTVVPFIYIVAATGLALLLQQWFTVFPRNPFARSLALIVIIAAISMSVFYNTHRYFVAWPRTPAVQIEFSTEQSE